MSVQPVLLFDLGGVLINFSGVDGIQPFLPEPLDPATIRSRFVASPSLREFEIGALSPVEFGQRFIQEWRLRVPVETFLAEFRNWSEGYLPGARKLLGQLRPHHRLAALSNSNALHWDRNARDLNVPAWFDAVFSSHQLGQHKPAPGSYLAALAALGVSPEYVTFFDDALANVGGARAVGIRSFQVAGVAELTACLRSIGALEL